MSSYGRTSMGAWKVKPASMPTTVTLSILVSTCMLIPPMYITRWWCPAHLYEGDTAPKGGYRLQNADPGHAMIIEERETIHGFAMIIYSQRIQEKSHSK